MAEERIRILSVEDDKIDQMAFERLVKRENLPYDYKIAGSVSEAREVLAAERFDAVLMDYMLGDGTGFDLFGEARDAPIVMMTGSGDEAVAVQAMKAGAYDYIIKDPEGNYLTTLPVTVESVISRRRAEEELERHREHLEELVEERTTELTRANEQLLAEIAMRQQAEEALGERVKELTCLYAVSRDKHEDLSADELCRRAVEHLVPAMQFPEITVAMIELDGKQFISEKYTEELSHGLHAKIRVGGEARGQVWVYYAEERPFIIPEEQNLVNGVAEALGMWLGRKRAEERLEHLNLVLRAIRRVNQLIVREKDRDRLLQGACDDLIETRGYHNAWIALLDEAGRLVATTEAGLGERFATLIEWLKRGELTACGQRALSQSEVVVTEDPPSTCADCPLAAHYGGQGALTIRLEHGSKVYGLLSASIPADLTADEEEQVLFQEVVGDIAFALHGIELEEERQRAEEALRESEERFSLAVRGSNAGIWDWDIQNNALYWSPRLKELLGYADEELDVDFDTFESHLHPDDRGHTAAAIEAHLKDRELYDVEQRLRTKSGEYRWFLARGQALWDEAGNPLRMIGSTTDITKRKRAEEAVQRHLERIEALREIDRAIISTLDLTSVLDIILKELERVIPYHSAGIFLLSDDTARLAAGRGFPDMEHVLQLSFPVKEDPLTRELMQENRPLVLTDAQADERFLARADTGYVRSWIGVPLIARDRAVGFLTIDHREPGVYGKESAEMAQAFAGQVAIAIENARLYEEAQRELAERKRAEKELRQSRANLQKALEGTVTTLVSVIEMKDPYTAGHQRRVSQLACAIAKDMGLPVEQIEGLRMAGLIHDLGKITVPAEVLSKPGQLSDLEWGMIKAHPKVGYDILKTVEFPWPVAQIVLEHHERIDGSGYPQGLSGEDTLMKARILAVADVVEAMASHRPYRPARGIDEALEEIAQNRGILYDAEVVDACLKLFTEKGFAFE